MPQLLCMVHGPVQLVVRYTCCRSSQQTNALHCLAHSTVLQWALGPCVTLAPSKRSLATRGRVLRATLTEVLSCSPQTARSTGPAGWQGLADVFIRLPSGCMRQQRVGSPHPQSYFHYYMQHPLISISCLLTIQGKCETETAIQ